MENSKKLIGIVGLVMINIAALGGIRNWAPIAECGLSSVLFLALASLFFLIPLSLVSAELSTTWDEEGGVYNWVTKAFGHKWGFLAIWFMWVQNVIWYPTALAIIASLLTYVVNPQLIHNKVIMSTIIFSLFWGATFINLSGIRISSWISTLGALCGTFIPSLLIIGLGFLWYFQGKPMEITFSKANLLPSLNSFTQLGIFAGVIVSLLGVEMSAVHSNNIEKPQKTFPKAILLTTLCVVFFSSLGVLAIAMVVPQSEISLNAGSIQAFEYFFKEYNLSAFTSPCAIIMSLGVLGSISTWIIGPCTGLLVASKKRNSAGFLSKENANGAPSNLLILQAIIVTSLTSLFLWMPTINSAYWILLVLSTQFYLFMYLLLFSAALKLRSSNPNRKNSFRIPGGKLGLWICCLAGIGMTIFSLIVTFFPPVEIQGLSHKFFFIFIPVSILLVSSIPLVLNRLTQYKPSPNQ